ncbi:MAG: hypothetical protein IBX61_08085 [Thermoleophilia bacterium]|nr:hypothetical protein [Thermoleophilia bacterium]
MFLIATLLVVLIGAGLRLVRHREERDAEGITEAFTAWFIFALVGLGGLFAFSGHAFVAEETAENIGFPAGNPFQFEVGVANLAFGVLGLLSLRYPGSFRWAAVIGYSVFMWGAAGLHIYERVVNDNRAPGNSGFPLYADIITPVLLLGLLILNHRLKSRSRRKHRDGQRLRQAA